MSKIAVKLKKTVDESYDVVISRGLLKSLPKQIKVLGDFGSIVIVTDDIVKKFYGFALQKQLLKNHRKVLLLSFAGGEKSKTQKTKTYLEEKMLRAKCGRDTLVIAMGGGVVGDLAGFVAATYLRGIPYVQVPTTLLGMVDSSFGGKTGIDTPQGKNLIGSFHQPKKIFIDPELADTLPAKQILNGYYEVVKMAITSNKTFFEFLERNLNKVREKDLTTLQHTITEGLKIKAKIVETDEKESEERMILNFGHTIGHALEQLSGYKLMHGEAVALGIIAEAKISVLEGLLPKTDFYRIKSLLLNSGLDVASLKKYFPSQIINAAKTDKKTRGDRLRVVLIEGIGRLYSRGGMAASFLSDEVIKKALKDVVTEV